MIATKALLEMISCHQQAMRQPESCLAVTWIGPLRDSRSCLVPSGLELVYSPTSSSVSCNNSVHTLLEKGEALVWPRSLTRSGTDHVLYDAIREVPHQTAKSMEPEQTKVPALVVELPHGIHHARPCNSLRRPNLILEKEVDSYQVDQTSMTRTSGLDDDQDDGIVQIPFE